MNRKLVEISNSNYGKKSYLLNLLNYGIEAKSTWLQAGLYNKDTESEFDNIEIVESTVKKIKTEANPSVEISILEKNKGNHLLNGFIKRREYFVKSKGKII